MNKITRKKNSDYTVVSNVFLRDKNLSIKAKGFLAVVMGLPDNWEFTINGICSILKEGKTAVYNVINELKDAGYCKAKRIQNEKGIIQGYDYSFFEMPQCEEQDSDNPYTEKPHMDNQPQLSKEEIKYEINKEERDKSLSKKEQIDYDSIMTAWNEVAASMPKLSSVRNITEDRKQKIRTLFKKCNSNTEELIRFIKTLPYADDWVIGQQKGRDWVITFTWLISNVNGWYSTALEGGMHKNNRYMFDKIMKGKKGTDSPAYSKKEDKLVINGIEYE